MTDKLPPEWGPTTREYHEERERNEHAKGNGSHHKESFAELVDRLARLPSHAYDVVRERHAQEHNVRVGTLDKAVAKAHKKLGADADDKQGRGISFPEPEPWPEPIDGPVLLDSLAEAIGRHVVMAEHSRDAAVLWVIHTYLLDHFVVSPRLAIRSPMKRCGKTTLLDVISRLVLRPLPVANVTASAMFRIVEAYRPALLVDEADTFLRDSDELRGVINSGHRRGGSVLRTVGDDFEPRQFSTYSAVAIALIGKLPDTLHDRSITIDLKRRLPSEEIKAFRPDRARHLDEIARKIARWAQDNANCISKVDPEMPVGVYNREADNWRPLLAIAETAGGDWPERAREAVTESRAAAGDDESRLVVLLTDIAAIFTEKDTDRLLSADMVDFLVAIQGRPWADYGKNDKPLTQNQLARLLKPVAIAPDTIRTATDRGKGYQLHQFKEAFARYLSSEGGSQPCNRDKCDEIRTSDTFQSVTTESGVTVEKCKKPNNDGLCHGVTVGKGELATTARPPSVCVHCGSPATAAHPVQECWVDGEQMYVHRRCQDQFTG
jgi:putative DNA primase/helicase